MTIARRDVGEIEHKRAVHAGYAGSCLHGVQSPLNPTLRAGSEEPWAASGSIASRPVGTSTRVEAPKREPYTSIPVMFCPRVITHLSDTLPWLYFEPSGVLYG